MSSTVHIQHRLPVASVLTMAAAAVSFTPLLLAGTSYKCTLDTQTCLDEMVADLQDRGWVGIEMDQDEETGVLVVKRVIPGSPAEAAGFQPGDALLEVSGIPLDEKSQPALKKNREKMVPGAVMEYTVRRGEEKKTVAVTLGKLPPDVYYQMIGMHMLEHASTPSRKP